MEKTMRREKIPVLISGCGPVGLTMSLLLHRAGIPHVLIEKRERISMLPRARGVTMRTVEIWTQLGLGPQLDLISLPPLWTEFFVYTETMAGRIVGRMKTEGMLPGALSHLSPINFKVTAQDRIDPMLYDAIVENGMVARFNTELMAYRETEGGIIATLNSPEGEYEIEAQYVIGADGGKSPLRQMAGIEESEARTFTSYVNNHLRADLTRFTKGREGTLIWALKPGAEGLFQMLDGDKDWAVHIQYDPATDSGQWPEERVLATLHRMIGVPEAEEVEFDILRSYTYTITSMLPKRIRAGRVLLIGDAAHVLPPYGGLGMNTGIQTAHNLSWKLAAVLRGEAGDALLESYDFERREVAQRVTEFGRTNNDHLQAIMRGVRTAASPEEQERLIESSRTYGNFTGLDLGVHYDKPGAFVPDDSVPPPLENVVTDYVQHAKPGWRAPHLWLRSGAKRVSSVLLFDRFTLLAGPEGRAWVEAARKLDLPNTPAIAAYRVADDGDLVPESDFTVLYGIAADGAVLVRPDGHVGWRCAGNAADPAQVLRAAMDTMLCRA
jgi:putative polyketide hydroxylase